VVTEGRANNKNHQINLRKRTGERENFKKIKTTKKRDHEDIK